MAVLHSLAELQDWDEYRTYMRARLKQLGEDLEPLYVSREPVDFVVGGKPWSGYALLAGSKTFASVQKLKKDGVRWREGACRCVGKELLVEGLPGTHRKGARKTLLKLKLGYRLAEDEEDDDGEETWVEESEDSAETRADVLEDEETTRVVEPEPAPPAPDDLEPAWRRLKARLAPRVREVLAGGPANAARIQALVRAASERERARDHAAAIEAFEALEPELAEAERAPAARPAQADAALRASWEKLRDAVAPRVQTVLRARPENQEKLLALSSRGYAYENQGAYGEAIDAYKELLGELSYAEMVARPPDLATEEDEGPEEGPDEPPEEEPPPEPRSVEPSAADLSVRWRRLRDAVTPRLKAVLDSDVPERDEIERLSRAGLQSERARDLGTAIEKYRQLAGLLERAMRAVAKAAARESELYAEFERVKRRVWPRYLPVLVRRPEGFDDLRVLGTRLAEAQRRIDYTQAIEVLERLEERLDAAEDWLAQRDDTGRQALLEKLERAVTPLVAEAEDLDAPEAGDFRRSLDKALRARDAEDLDEAIERLELLAGELRTFSLERKDEAEEEAGGLREWTRYRKLVRMHLKTLGAEPEPFFVSREPVEFDVGGEPWEGLMALVGKRGLRLARAMKKEGVKFRVATCVLEEGRLVASELAPPHVKQARKTFLKLKLGVRLVSAEGDEEDEAELANEEAAAADEWERLRARLDRDLARARAEDVEPLAEIERLLGESEALRSSDAVTAVGLLSEAAELLAGALAELDLHPGGRVEEERSADGLERRIDDLRDANDEDYACHAEAEAGLVEAERLGAAGELDAAFARADQVEALLLDARRAEREAELEDPEEAEGVVVDGLSSGRVEAARGLWAAALASVETGRTTLRNALLRPDLAPVHPIAGYLDGVVAQLPRGLDDDLRRLVEAVDARDEPALAAARTAAAASAARVQGFLDQNEKMIRAFEANPFPGAEVRIAAPLRQALDAVARVTTA